MSSFYDRLAATARRLIKDKGQAAALLRTGTPTGPAHDPQPGADVRTTCYVVETGYSLTDRDTTLVEQGDKLGLISTELDGFVPAKTDRIEIGGLQYHFLDLQPLAPGGTVLLYEFHARR